MMTTISLRPRRIAAVLLLAFAAMVAAWRASAEPNRVTFPDRFGEMVHYTTVTRGTTDELMWTSPDVIEAVRQGKEVPDGTRFVLEERREGTLYRYFVMQKGKGWGDDYDARRRTGNWQFQWFTPAKAVNLAENTARCQSCHGAQARSDFLLTTGSIRSAR